MVKGIRTGERDNYDRVVFEFKGELPPGFRVEYLDKERTAQKYISKSQSEISNYDALCVLCALCGYSGNSSPLWINETDIALKVEIYVSTDVETDGPIPGPHSMLSFGSAAYLADKTLVGTFSANLETLPGAAGDRRTMKWWQTQPAAWAACRKDLQPPEAAIKEYVAWLKALPGVPVFVGYPATFDFMFIQWYLIKFAGESPFSFVGLDVKTFAWAMLKTNFRETLKSTMPKRWFDDLPHTHEALDDAKEQGALFCNMLAEHLKED